MDPATAIIAALAAGAAAAAKDTASHAIKDAYEGLKSLLSKRLHSLPLIENNHQSAAAKAAAVEEVQAAGLAEDVNVVAKARHVVEALSKEPQAAMAAGISLSNLKAVGDILVADNRVSVQASDIQARNIEIRGNSGNG